MKSYFIWVLVVISWFGCSKDAGTTSNLGPLALPISITNAVVRSERFREKTWVLTAKLSKREIDAIVQGLGLTSLAFDPKRNDVASLAHHLPKSAWPGMQMYAGRSDTAPGFVKMFVATDGTTTLILQQV